MGTAQWLHDDASHRCGFVRETEQYLSFYQWDSLGHVFTHSTRKLSRSQRSQALTSSPSIFNRMSYVPYIHMLDEAREKAFSRTTQPQQRVVKPPMFEASISYRQSFIRAVSRRVVYPLSAAMSLSGMIFPPMMQHAKNPALSIPLILFVLVALTCFVVGRSFVKLFTALPLTTGDSNELSTRSFNVVLSYARYNYSEHCGEMVETCCNMAEATNSDSVDYAVMEELVSFLARCSDEEFDAHQRELFTTVRNVPEMLGHCAGVNFARRVTTVAGCHKNLNDGVPLSHLFEDRENFMVESSVDNNREEKRCTTLPSADPVLVLLRRIVLDAASPSQVSSAVPASIGTTTQKDNNGEN